MTLNSLVTSSPSWCLCSRTPQKAEGSGIQRFSLQDIWPPQRSVLVLLHVNGLVLSVHGLRKGAGLNLGWVFAFSSVSCMSGDSSSPFVELFFLFVWCLAVPIQVSPKRELPSSQNSQWSRKWWRRAESGLELFSDLDLSSDQDVFSDLDVSPDLS